MSISEDRPRAGLSAASASGAAARAEAGPSDSRLLRIRVALFLAGFATFSLIYCTQPILPELSQAFSVSPAASSLALSMTTGALAIAILCAGAISESFGRRGLMFVSMIAAAVLNLAAAVTVEWHLLLAVRTLEGLVLGGVPAVAMAYLAEEMPKARLGAAMGLYVGGTALGGMSGRVLIGILTEHSDWRMALGAMAVLDLLIAIAFVFLLPASRNFVRRPGLGLGFHLTAWGAHLRHPALPLLFATGFLSMGAFVTVYNYAGFRLIAPPYDLDQSQIGLIFLAYLFGMVASPTAGYLADRFGRAGVVALGAIGMLAGLVITLTAPLAVIIVGVVLLTIGFFTVHAVASGWVGRLAEANKSHAASLYLLAYYAGSSIMGSMGGWFWHADGWPGVVAFSGVMTALILAIAGWLALSRRG
ncbi:MFS transporter [Segnochrobactraceae bacterium EtOH-i3]